MPRGLVDDPHERKIILRVQKKSKIGHDILVFLAIEERQSLDDLVRNAVLQEGRFKRSRQRVDARNMAKSRYECCLATTASLMRFTTWSASSRPVSKVKTRTGSPSGPSETNDFSCAACCVR